MGVGKAELLERELVQVVSVPRSVFEQSPLGHELLSTRLGLAERGTEAGLDSVTGDWHIGLGGRYVPGAEVKLPTELSYSLSSLLPRRNQGWQEPRGRTRGVCAGRAAQGGSLLSQQLL